MTTAQSLHKQFTQLVRELNDQGLQLRDIEEHPDIQRIGTALWGATALRNQIRNEIRRALQTDIDKETGIRNRISVPQVKLPLPELDPSAPAVLHGLRDYLRTVSLDPMGQLISAEEVLKDAMGRIKKSGVFLESELKIMSKAATAVLKSVKTRLHQSNGSDIDE